MQTFTIILEIYVACSLLPVIIFFLTKKYQEPSMVYLVVILVASFLVDGFGLANSLWLRLGPISNGVGTVYEYLEYAMILLLFQAQLAPHRKLPFILTIVVLIVIQTIETFAFRGVTDFHAISMAIFAIVVTVLVLAYFFKLMRSLPTVHIYYIPMFWISIGMLAFFTGNFFLYVVRDYLVKVMKDNMIFYWSLHNILGIISYLFYAIGMWQAKNARTQAA